MTEQSSAIRFAARCGYQAGLAAGLAARQDDMVVAAPVTTIFTETTGTTAILGGQHGTVVGIIRETGFRPRVQSAFVRLDGPTDTEGTYIAPGAMLHVRLGAALGTRGENHEVIDWVVIDRDEFDRLNGIDTLRAELGWS